MTEVTPNQPLEDHADRLKAELLDKVGAGHFIPAPRSSDLYVFFLFDLVNSTGYKQRNGQDWLRVTHRFYDLVARGLSRHLTGVRLWKYVGDEVLLYKRIRNPSDLYECVPAAYNKLQDAVRAIHSEFADTKIILSVKGVVWCARVHQPRADDFSAATRGDSKEYTNILLYLQDYDRQEPVEPRPLTEIDFLGPGIDVGFRIMRFARRLRLVVSAELAYLLVRDRTNVLDHGREWVEDRLRIVGYENLKGIWGDRRYPIIWYESDWQEFEDSLWYDERFDRGFAHPVADPLLSPQAQVRNVVRVFRDVNLLAEQEELHSFLHQLDLPTEDHIPPRGKSVAPAGSAPEVHCVAVCVRPIDGHILVAQRPSTKRRLKDHWEFGCGQLSTGETWKECLRRNYKEDFGADLDFGTELQPLRTFVVEDREEGRHIPGMIFYAEVTNPDEVHAPKHQKHEWVNPADPASWKALEKRVPDLEDSIAAAYRVWQERHRQG